MASRTTAIGALLGLFCLAGVAVAQRPDDARALIPGPLLVAADSRQGIELSGSWTWSIDPYRDGLVGFHGDPAGEASQRFIDRDPEEIAREDPTRHFEQDMRRSARVTLPQSWITHDPTMRHYDGLVWYQRAFDARPRRGQRAFLRFGAVDYRAHVYLNGKLVGTHDGGFTPFGFEVTGLLLNGENRVTVGADAERTAETVPPPVTDWETYGGITRPVRLLFTPATFIDDAWVRLTRDGRIAATVTLDGAAKSGVPVRVRIPSLGFTLEGRTGADGSWAGTAAAPAALQRWSPEAPTLYDVSIESGGDRLADRVGFRTIEVRGEDIVLNGRPIFLRGISLHEEEFGKEPTRAITPAAARALLTEAKQGLHANFVRLAHYPHSEAMTRMADELGLIVWSEIPVYWRIAWDNPATLSTARRMLAENILRDRNRASIALWSVANETPVGNSRNIFLRRLIADARWLDDSRLITAALLTERTEAGGKVSMRIDDPLAADLDVMAINTYNGWYTPDRLASLPDIAWRSAAGKPLILSEFGADALAGFHDPQHSRKFSEEFQAEYYRRTLEMAAKIPFLGGMSPWILKDFRSPRRQHPIFQQGWNRKGLVSETGQRKQAFDVLADHYLPREREER